MEIKRSGSQASTKGLVDWFTGNVRIDPLFDAPELSTASLRPARVRGVSVTFEVATGRARPTADRVLAPPGIHIHSARH
jgi:hypothetical protein